MTDKQKHTPGPLGIKRYIHHDERKRWDSYLDEWMEDHKPDTASREKRAAFWFLLELRSAEEVIGKLQTSNADMLEALSDMVHIARAEGWDKSLNGRQLVFADAEAAIKKAKGEQ